MPENCLTLTGLDAANPLAFLAALGVLRGLDLRARSQGRPLPSLSWSDEGCWRPVIHGPPSVDALIAELLEDRDTWHLDPAFAIAYDDAGDLVELQKAEGKVTRDLKPKPAAMRAFLDNLASRASRTVALSGTFALRRALDTAAMYGSEIVQDNKGNTKPTAFHFTAGTQQFMGAVAALQTGVNALDLHEALVGPWLRESTLPNMGWDATNARLYAFRATNPSDDKKTTVAGADWLAFIGLGAFPSFPRGTRLVTTGVEGGWKDSRFAWPVWDKPATFRVACSVCRTAGLSTLPRAERKARGIAAVFTSRICRTDQGGYGSFAPAIIR